MTYNLTVDDMHARLFSNERDFYVNPSQPLTWDSQRASLTNKKPLTHGRGGNHRLTERGEDASP